MEQKLFKLKEMDGSKGEGSAIIAELNKVDHDGDITIEGAFGEQQVNLLGSHQHHTPRLGKATLKEDGGFAVADFKSILTMMLSGQRSGIRHSSLTWRTVNPCRSGLMVLIL